MSAFFEYVPGRFTTPLDAAQAEHTRGRRCIGYLSDDVPVELILAADALPVRLDARVDSPTPRADKYLESSFSPAYRSYLEQWLRGELDFLDCVIFSRSNDSAQRLYYYICELQRCGAARGPTPLIYDVARIARATSRAHTIAATESLAQTIGTVPANLDAARQRVQSRVAFARRLSALRVTANAIAGSDVVQAWRALQLDWTEQFEHTVREWSVVAQRQTFNTRFIFAGSTPPDDRLHRAVEAGGGNVVDEFFDGSLAQCIARWNGASPTVESIADNYRAARSTDTAWLESPTLLLERARAVGAHGVVLWLIDEDEGIVWELPSQMEQLRKAGIPLLALTRQPWSADTGTLDRVTEFARLEVHS